MASRPNPATDTLAHYQALPVAHHQLEEATYLLGALGWMMLWAWQHPLTPPPRSFTSTCAAPPATPTSGGGGLGHNDVEGTAPPTPLP